MHGGYFILLSLSLSLMLLVINILQQTSIKAPMEVVNPADVPDYEVNAKELGTFKREPKLPGVLILSYFSEPMETFCNA